MSNGSFDSVQIKVYIKSSSCNCHCASSIRGRPQFKTEWYCDLTCNKSCKDSDLSGRMRGVIQYEKESNGQLYWQIQLITPIGRDEKGSYLYPLYRAVGSVGIPSKMIREIASKLTILSVQVS